MAPVKNRMLANSAKRAAYVEQLPRRLHERLGRPASSREWLDEGQAAGVWFVAKAAVTAREAFRLLKPETRTLVARGIRFMIDGEDYIARGADYMHARERLTALADLPAGWLDGDGLAIAAHSRGAAAAALNLLEVEGLPEPRIFPTSDGLVSAEWTAGEWAIGAIFRDRDQVELQIVNARTLDDTEVICDVGELARHVQSALARGRD